VAPVRVVPPRTLKAAAGTRAGAGTLPRRSKVGSCHCSCPTLFHPRWACGWALGTGTVQLCRGRRRGCPETLGPTSAATDLVPSAACVPTPCSRATLLGGRPCQPRFRVLCSKRHWTSCCLEWVGQGGQPPIRCHPLQRAAWATAESWRRWPQPWQTRPDHGHLGASPPRQGPRWRVPTMDPALRRPGSLVAGCSRADRQVCMHASAQESRRTDLSEAPPQLPVIPQSGPVAPSCGRARATRRRVGCPSQRGGAPRGGAIGRDGRVSRPPRPCRAAAGSPRPAAADASQARCNAGGVGTAR